MSWLQEHRWTLTGYERPSTSSKTLFHLQLAVERHGYEFYRVTAKRSYSEFRALWKALQRATYASPEQAAAAAAAAAENPASERHESWNVVSRRLLTRIQPLKRTSCRCTKSVCPFRRLHGILREFPFPSKHFGHPKEVDLRRHELDKFLEHVRGFFLTVPSKFLDNVAAARQCQVLGLLAEFLGYDGGNLADWDKRLLETPDAPERSLPGARRPRMDNISDNRSISCGLLRRNLNGSTISPSSGGGILRPVGAGGRELSIDEHERGRLAAPTPLAPPRPPLAPSSLPSLRVRQANVQTASPMLLDWQSTFLRRVSHVATEKLLGHTALSEEAKWQRALFAASDLGLYSDVLVLLRRGTDPNAAVFQGNTALHAACLSGHANVCQALLGHGADANRLGPTGRTPLMIAVSGGSLEIARVLLRAQANVNQRNTRGLTALHLARAGDSRTLIDLLVQYGATTTTTTTRSTATSANGEAGDEAEENEQGLDDGGDLARLLGLYGDDDSADPHTSRSPPPPSHEHDEVPSTAAVTIVRGDGSAPVDPQHGSWTEYVRDSSEADDGDGSGGGDAVALTNPTFPTSTEDIVVIAHEEHGMAIAVL